MAIQTELLCLQCLCLILLTLFLVVLPFAVAISLTLYIIVYLVSCFFTNYDKFISCIDVLLDEDFVNSLPKTSIVISLTLQGDLSLDNLKYLFTENVLKSTFKANPNKLRYSRLKQYLTTFICFRVWKNDPCFHIDNHIGEKLWTGSDLETIHQEYLNKPYSKQRSPWELILIRNVGFEDDSDKESKTYLVFRVPHVMGDAKSLLKLLVECLGNKELKTSSPRKPVQNTRQDGLLFILYFPWKCICECLRIILLLYSSFKHPWKVRDCFTKSNGQTDKVVVSFSSKIGMCNLKQVAKQNNVRTSAVVISLVAGAIRRICGGEWNKPVAISYVLPKANHPESLTNHASGSLMELPTDQRCELKRLHQCNQYFTQRNLEQKGKYADLVALLTGSQIYPINRLFFNAFVPVGITNNAGEKEGFSVGNAECIDYRMSVGTQRGVLGVLFCTISYKDAIRIAVIAQESILSKETADRLASHIESELEVLLAMP